MAFFTIQKRVLDSLKKKKKKLLDIIFFYLALRSRLIVLTWICPIYPKKKKKGFVLTGFLFLVHLFGVFESLSYL